MLVPGHSAWLRDSMRHSVAGALAIACLCAVFAGCGDDPAPSAAPGGTATSSSGGDTGTTIGDALENDDSAGNDIPVTTGTDCPGGAGCPCQQNDDCDTAVCIETSAGGRCAQKCVDACPGGTTCSPIDVGSDTLNVCVPKWGFLCAPCQQSAECKAIGQASAGCVDYGGAGGFCGASCASLADCPGGYVCKASATVEGTPIQQCVLAPTAVLPGSPEPGVCGCSPRATQKGLTTLCSVSHPGKDGNGEPQTLTCTGFRSCSGTGLSACDAAKPATEVCDTIDNDCDGTTDDATCDDQNPCTTDTCKPGAGKAGQAAGCTHEPREGTCSDGDACTLDDVCQAGACAPGKQVCECDTDSDCAAKEDGDACNGTLFCDAGHFPRACTVNPGTVVICPNGAGTACADLLCAPKDGKCKLQAVTDGKPCDADATPCTPADGCQNGACVADTKNICQCTQDDDCSDKGDGNLCTGTLFCNKQTGNCQLNPATVVHCSAVLDTDCQKAACEPQTGACTMHPEPANTPCDDANACTVGEVCATTAAGQGVCQPSANTCVCGLDADCVSKEDGDLCNGTLFCNKATGKCQLNPTTVITCPTVGDTACLKNACVKTLGKCVPQPTVGTNVCSDDNVCTEGDVCAAGACKPGTNTCACKADSECANKDDGDKCNGTLFCDKQDGACKLNPATIIQCADADDTPCVQNRCQKADGSCVMTGINPGLACDDGDPCTQGDFCAVTANGAGACKSGLKACQCQTNADCATKEDGNPCNGTLVCAVNAKGAGQCVVNPATIVACAKSDDTACRKNRCQFETGQCALVAVNDGKDCNDDNACTAGDRCTAGVCEGPTYLCSCTATKDCAKYDDGNLCNGVLYCDTAAKPFACRVNPTTLVTCPQPGVPACQKSWCEPKTGKCGVLAIAEGATCTDADACSEAERCKDGACAGSPVACDDGDACTTDLCDKGAGCLHLPLAASACDDGQVCTFDACDAAAGCVYVGLSRACDDGDACTVGDRCLLGACAPIGARGCDDNNPCTTDGCLPKSGCVNLHNAAACTDGDACTISDACKDGACVSGEPATCATGNGCLLDSCDAKAGCVHLPRVGTCTDNNACTLGDRCVVKGTVAGVPDARCEPEFPAICDDGNGCTTDACVAKTGCVHADNELSCSDGSSCTQDDRCGGGKCLAGVVIDCTDQTPCTDDKCVDGPDGKGGCVHLPNQATCDDSSVCTGGDFCAGGVCQPGKAKGCDDGNPCTDDACDAAKGCVYVNNTVACDDGDACTEKTACSGGKCVGGGQVDCDDGDVCTDDSCDQDKGCQQASNSAGCDDGDACTELDKCVGGACVPGGLVPICKEDPCAGPKSKLWDVTLAATPSFKDLFARAAVLGERLVGCGAKASATGKAGAYLAAVDSFGSKVWEYRTEEASDFVDCVALSEQRLVAVLGPTVPSAALFDAAGKRLDAVLEGTMTKAVLFALDTTIDGAYAAGRDGNDSAAARALVARMDANGKIKWVNAAAPVGSSYVEVTTLDNGDALAVGDIKLSPTVANTFLARVRDGKLIASRDINLPRGAPTNPHQQGLASWGDDVLLVIEKWPYRIDALLQTTTGKPVTTVAGSNIIRVGDGLRIDDGRALLPAALLSNTFATLLADRAGRTVGERVYGPGVAYGAVLLADGSRILVGSGLRMIRTDPWGHSTCKDAGPCSAKKRKDCDDGNGCTFDECDPAKGCTYMTSTAPCDDGDTCTDNDECSGGACKAGASKSCDDQNPCTTDTCDAKTGCKHAHNNAACDDNDKCTEKDGCMDGKCAFGAKVNCDDGNACTADGCVTVAGCIHNSVSQGTACNDGNPCTAGDACDKGVCLAGKPNAKCADGLCPPGAEKLFDKTYGGTGSDAFTALAAHKDGGFAAAGHTDSQGAGKADGWLVRLDATGKQVWDKTYGNAQANVFAGIAAVAIPQTATGIAAGYAMAGTTDLGAGAGKDGWLVRVDEAGKLIWQNGFGGAKDDELLGIVALSDGDFAAAGYTASTGKGGKDGWVIRVDSKGNVGSSKAKWDVTFGYGKDEVLSAIVGVTDAAGQTLGIAMAGRTASRGLGAEDGWLLRLQDNGELVYDYTLGVIPDDGFAALVATTDRYRFGKRKGQRKGNSFALAGWAEDAKQAGAYRYRLVRTNSDGYLIWDQTYGDGKFAKASALAVIPDGPKGDNGGFLLSGADFGSGGGDALVVRTDVFGRTVWSKAWGGSKPDRVDALLRLGDGSMVGVGLSAGGVAGGLDAWMVRGDAWGHRSCVASGVCAALSVGGCADGNSCSDEICQNPVGCSFPQHSGDCAGDSSCTAMPTCVDRACSGATLKPQTKVQRFTMSKTSRPLTVSPHQIGMCGRSEEAFNKGLAYVVASLDGREVRRLVNADYDGESALCVRTPAGNVLLLGVANGVQRHAIVTHDSTALTMHDSVVAKWVKAVAWTRRGELVMASGGIAVAAAHVRGTAFLAGTWSASLPSSSEPVGLHPTTTGMLMAFRSSCGKSCGRAASIALDGAVTWNVVLGGPKAQFEPVDSAHVDNLGLVVVGHTLNAPSSASAFRLVAVDVSGVQRTIGGGKHFNRIAAVPGGFVTQMNSVGTLFDERLTELTWHPDLTFDSNGGSGLLTVAGTRIAFAGSTSSDVGIKVRSLWRDVSICAAECSDESPATCTRTELCIIPACTQNAGCGVRTLVGGCSDNNPCTTNDTCKTGTCTPGPANDCNDQDPCTNDTCDTTKGCQNLKNTGSCNDDNACTSNDTCATGTCAGTPKPCDDGNPCTKDSCFKATGCASVPLADGTSCDGGKTCSFGICG